MPFLGLEPIDGQHHRLHVRIGGGQLAWSLAAGRQHLLVAVNVGLDRVSGEANLVRVRSSARICPTDQWRAKRRWPSQHTTSQPSTHHGMATAVSASGLSVWGWAGQARVGQCASLQTRCRGPLSVNTRLGRLSAKFGVPKKCCSLKSTGCGNDLEKTPPRISLINSKRYN